MSPFVAGTARTGTARLAACARAAVAAACFFLEERVISTIARRTTTTATTIQTIRRRRFGWPAGEAATSSSGLEGGATGLGAFGVILEPLSSVLSAIVS